MSVDGRRSLWASLLSAGHKFIVEDERVESFDEALSLIIGTRGFFPLEWADPSEPFSRRSVDRGPEVSSLLARLAGIVDGSKSW